FGRFGFENSAQQDFAISPVSQFINTGFVYSISDKSYGEPKKSLTLSSDFIAAKEFMGNRNDINMKRSDLQNNATDNLRIYNARQIISNSNISFVTKEGFGNFDYFQASLSNSVYSENSYRGIGNFLNQN